jgi:hypothetical protein
MVKLSEELVVLAEKQLGLLPDSLVKTARRIGLPRVCALTHNYTCIISG